VAEKITAAGEELRDWPVAGTTGYEFCNEVTALFVDPDAEPMLDAVDADMGGDPRPYGEQAEAAKREMLTGGLAADVRRLARALWSLVQRHPEVRDVDDHGCLAAMTDVLVALDVYRTYVDPVTGAHDPEDIARVEAAVERALRRPAGPPALYPFLARALTGRAGDSPAHLDLLARVQQLTGALTAKGVEDTAFYRYRRLLAVNEVGGEPSRLGLDVAGFHARNAARAPAGMLTTATHDTKRGEDARLRIAALSEVPLRWAQDVRRWHVAHAPFVTDTPAGPAPDAQTRLALYQTLVAVWHGQETAGVRDRVAEYLVKSSREAAQRTSWRDPDEEFEAGTLDFLDRLLADEDARAEISDLAAVCFEIAAVSGLSQVLLRVTSPGVPDTYQGTEDWDTSLVDPDNRRPVDWGRRRASLDRLRAGGAPRDFGERKLALIVRALALRARRPEAFDERGDYEPVEAGDGVCAFARGGVVLVVAPVRAWDDAMLRVPPSLRGRWRSVIAGAEQELGADAPVSAIVRDCAFALLER
jgi:(1->4)-alpha-D-glucan 1-alpha-D-glucosylmutase